MKNYEIKTHSPETFEEKEIATLIPEALVAAIENALWQNLDKKTFNSVGPIIDSKNNVTFGVFRINERDENNLIPKYRVTIEKIKNDEIVIPIPNEKDLQS